MEDEEEKEPPYQWRLREIKSILDRVETYKHTPKEEEIWDDFLDAFIEHARAILNREDHRRNQGGNPPDGGRLR